MKSTRLALAAATGLAAFSAGADDGAPLSAIPWLSESVEQPVPDPAAKPVSRPIRPPEAIDVAPLPPPDPGVTGLRPAQHRALWAQSDMAVVNAALRDMPVLQLPAAQSLFLAILVAEAAPPRAQEGTDSDFLLSRIDALLLTGALEPALALIERAGPEQPRHFRRWFDVSLLTGYEKRACATMAATPSLAPTAAARVFCLAREGRWETAVVTLEATAALGTLAEDDAYRMARFLDPELFEGDPPMPRPDPVTPLLFRVHEALGEPIPTRTLPLAFAQSDLRHIVGWKSQIEAAERLARVGAVPANTLLGIYSAREPSASGGVWERVSRMQALDIALNSGRPDAVARTLEPARVAMAEAGLEMVFAHLVSPRLSRLSLRGEAGHSALRLRLLSNGPRALEPAALPDDVPPDLAFAAALAVGQAARAVPPGPRAVAVRAAFLADSVAPADLALLDEQRTGEALLRALRLVADGGEASPSDVARAISLLRALDRETTATQIVLQYLLTGPGA